MKLDTLEGFKERLQGASVVPVVREILADWWTPVAAYHRLAGQETGTFLFESVERGERVGRYSFLGRRPFLIVKARGDRLWVEGEEAGRFRDLSGGPLQQLGRILDAFRAPRHPDLPPLVSGAVGHFGYDTVRWVERIPREAKADSPEEDLALFFPEEIAAFDHVRRRLYLVANARVFPGDDPKAAWERARRSLDGMEEALSAPFAPPLARMVGSSGTSEPGSNTTPDAFRKNVLRAKEHVAAGDIFQVVLSQRFTLPGNPGDLALYRALRAVNPSPYMFLLRYEGWSAVGSSPEPLLCVDGDRLLYRPIAGTAPRSADAAEDRRLAEALQEDPKERAEHVMLVDLGRNDLGRVAVAGSVRVEELMTVERYSHVMHLVSGLAATLRPGVTPLEALYACFPAGTVTGAPKVRAMEIIEALEPDHRGVYAGAVGYLDFAGNLDTCIALRTLIARKDVVCVQAGAGIVADSDPDREYEETRHKARALLQAAEAAWSLRGGNA